MTDMDVHFDMSTPEKFRKVMDNEIIPGALARMKTGKIFYICVGENKRQDTIREIRAYLKHKGVPNSIERVLKVVQEERCYEDECYGSN